MINLDLQVIKQKRAKKKCYSRNSLHTFTHQQSHSTFAIQREGINDNVEKGEEKVYSVMDDIFSKYGTLEQCSETRECRAGFKNPDKLSSIHVHQ